MDHFAAEWLKRLHVPANWDYPKSLMLMKKYEFDEFCAELCLQSNGPGTFQRLLKLLPKNISGPMPAVAVPFYYPEAMIGLEPETSEKLQKYAGITMMADLARRGYITASADSYHLTYVKSDLPRECFDRWQIAGEALLRDYPDWCGMGKLTVDTFRLVDALAEDSRVDRERIGIAGHSLGGKMAFYCGCLDSRIKAILTSDFGIGWDQTNWKDVWYWGSRVDELKKAGMDHSQLLSMSGGKPFFLLAGCYDNEESRRIMLQATGYEAHPEYREVLNHASGHRPPAEALTKGYEFLDRYLK